MKARILFVAPSSPYPEHSGAQIRTARLIEALRRDCEVRVVHGDGARPAQALRELGPYASSWLRRRPFSVSRYQSGRWRLALKQAFAEFSPHLIFCEGHAALEALSVLPLCPTVLSLHNVESDLMHQMAAKAPSRVRRWACALEAAPLRRFEAEALRRSALTIAVSEADARRFRALEASARLAVVESGVDVSFFKPAGPHRPGEIVFCGAMDWIPNQDAMHFFLAQCWPALRRRHPGLHLTLVGRNPPAWMKSNADITVTGSVPDVRPWLAVAELCIVPLRIGGGTRLKVLEACAMGLPVVSTSLGAEGLAVEAGLNILLADRAEDFITEIEQILASPHERQRLSREARRFAEGRDWNHLLGGLVARCLEAVGLSAKGAEATLMSR